MTPLPAAQKKTTESKSPTTLITVLVLAALIAAGWFWHRTASAQSSGAAGTTQILHLESFVVNVSGTGGDGYLRVGVDLAIGVDLKEGEARNAYIGEIRDTILTVLGTRTVDELLTPQGKAKLKEDMLKAIQERIPDLRCSEVYYTEFLVQH